jgi:hypothetical protein
MPIDSRRHQYCTLHLILIWGFRYLNCPPLPPAFLGHRLPLLATPLPSCRCCGRPLLPLAQLAQRANLIEPASQFPIRLLNNNLFFRRVTYPNPPAYQW